MTRVSGLIAILISLSVSAASAPPTQHFAEGHQPGEEAAVPWTARNCALRTDTVRPADVILSRVTEHVRNVCRLSFFNAFGFGESL